MPHESLERFRVGRHVLGVDRRYDHAGVGDLRGIATVPSHDSADCRTLGARELERAYDVRTHVTLQAAATDREDEHHVVAHQAASLEPVGKYGLPAVVVDSRR